MTPAERIALSIEMQACLNTAHELCRGDGYMNCTTAEIVDSLREKAKHIKTILEQDC